MNITIDWYATDTSSFIIRNVFMSNFIGFTLPYSVCLERCYIDLQRDICFRLVEDIFLK